MNRRLRSLIFGLLLALVACADSEGSSPGPARQDGASTTDVSQAESQTPDSARPQPAPSAADSGPVSVTTDRESYRLGESIVVAIANEADKPIQFREHCSLNQCMRQGGDWICVERECDGPMTILRPGDQLALMEEAASIGPASEDAVISRYKLDYQIVLEAPFRFAQSNEFTIQRDVPNCERAEEIALDHAQSSPFWPDIDAARVTVRWQNDSQSCTVDFAWHRAGEIRAGLWSEGYAVTVTAGSGRVSEANAYER